MGGNHKTALVDLQKRLKKVPGSDVQRWPAVPLELPDLTKGCVDTLQRLERRSEDQNVYATVPATLFPVTVHLRAEDELHPGPLEEPVAGVAQLAPCLFEPHQLGEIAARQEVDPLDLRPGGEVLERQVLARCAGEARVEMQVDDVGHGSRF